MKLLANENIPLKVVEELKKEGFNIVRIDEIQKGMVDEEVVRYAFTHNRILLTFDKDFGEIVFNSKERSKGVILLRFQPQSPDIIIRRVLSLLRSSIELENKFVVIEIEKIRVKEIEK